MTTNAPVNDFVLYGGRPAMAMAKTLLEIEKAIANGAPTLTLRFLGLEEMCPNDVLMLYDLLSSRPATQRLVAEARSSIVNAGVLLWLMADSRTLRRDAWIYFRKARTPVVSGTGGDSEDGSTEEEATNGGGFFGPWMAEPYWDTDYGRVLELANQFIPVSEWAGKRIPYARLKEFGLVECDGYDRRIAELFCAEPSGPMAKGGRRTFPGSRSSPC